MRPAPSSHGRQPLETYLAPSSLAGTRGMYAPTTHQPVARLPTSPRETQWMHDALECSDTSCAKRCARQFMTCVCPVLFLPSSFGFRRLKPPFFGPRCVRQSEVLPLGFSQGCDVVEEGGAGKGARTPQKGVLSRSPTCLNVIDADTFLRDTTKFHHAMKTICTT